MKRIISEIQLRFFLIKASIVYTFQLETAFRVNNIIGMIASLIFSLSFYIFAKVVYYNTDALAGYSYDEMMLFLFIAQCNYFVNRYITFLNVSDMVREVNRGNLDFLLIRPIPSLFYSLTKTINLTRMLTEALPIIAVFVTLINWNNIDMSLGDFTVGMTILLLGHLAAQFTQFLFALPVFWYGESTALLNLFFVFDYRLGRMIPFEGLSFSLKAIFSTVIPVLFATGISTSVLLNKSDALPMLLFTAAVVFCLMVIEMKLWKFALRSYTSASS